MLIRQVELLKEEIKSTPMNENCDLAEELQVKDTEIEQLNQQVEDRDK